MAYFLRWPADTGSATTNNKLCQISGIATSGNVNIALEFAEDFVNPDTTSKSAYLYDGRRSLNSDASNGSGYLFKDNTGIVVALTSNYKINGVGSTGSGWLTALTGDIYSFDSGAQTDGVIAIGARFNRSSSMPLLALRKITIVDNNGTHVIDMSDSGGTLNTFTSTDDILTLTLFNFSGTSHWVFYETATPITFTGTIPNVNLQHGDVVDIDYSGYFSGTETPFTFGGSGTSLAGTGLSFNTAGHLVGTAITSSVTGASITGTDDALNTATSNTFNVTITAATAVSFSGPVPDQTATVGVPFSLSLAPYFSGTLTPFTYSFSFGNLTGTGLSLNTSTGVISGIPTSVADLDLQVRATDTGTNTAATNLFALTIDTPTIIQSVDYDIGEIQYVASVTVSVPVFTSAIAYDIGQIDWSVAVSVIVGGNVASVSYDIGLIDYSVSASANAPELTAIVSYDIGLIDYAVAMVALPPAINVVASYDIGAIDYSVNFIISQPPEDVFASISYDIGVIGYAVVIISGEIDNLYGVGSGITFTELPSGITFTEAPSGVQF